MSTKAATLARQIETVRTARGISYRDLSEISGVPYSTLRRKLQYRPDLLDLPVLTALASALDAELTIGFVA